MTEGAASAFDAYVRAFGTLDPEAALPFFHVPCMFVAPQGVFAAPDAGTARALLSQFMGQLRRQSYGRTEVVARAVRGLAPGLASCAGTFVRFDTGGEEIARVGFTYILRDDGGTWRIVVAVVHDPIAG